MPEHLEPPPVPIGPGSSDDDHGRLRIRSRSPHPYHRLNSELLDPSDRIAYRPAVNAGDATEDDPSAASSHSFPSFARDSPLPSESGTEADDEHFLKGLPAPKARGHKGIRGRNEALSGASTPLLSPAVLEEEGRKPDLNAGHGGHERDKRAAAERSRRRKELVRRATEVLLLACQGGMVASNPDARSFLRLYRKGNYAVKRTIDVKLIRPM
jgi:hypothetical protein